MSLEERLATIRALLSRSRCSRCMLCTDWVATGMVCVRPPEHWDCAECGHCTAFHVPRWVR